MTCVRNTQMTIAIPPHAAEVWVKCIFQKQIAAFSDRQCSCLSELKHYLFHSRRSILRTFKCHCHIYLLCAYFSLQQYQYFPPLSFDRYQPFLFLSLMKNSNFGPSSLEYTDHVAQLITRTNVYYICALKYPSTNISSDAHFSAGSDIRKYIQQCIVSKY